MGHRSLGLQPVVLLLTGGLLLGGCEPATSPALAPAPSITAANSLGLPTAPAGRGGTTASASTVATQQTDRVEFGNMLPFALPAEMGIEVAGGAWISGSVTFAPSMSASVKTLVPLEGAVWTRVLIEPSRKTSLLGRSIASAERVQAPVLLDTEGQQHQALGFLYQDSTSRVVALEPQMGIRALSKTPALSGQRNDQKLWLLFSLPRGSGVRALLLGGKKVVEWSDTPTP